VLGAVLLSNGAVLDVMVIEAEDFYSADHSLLLECAKDLHDKGLPVDVVALQNALEARGSLERVGGQPYLRDLVENVPTAAPEVAKHYAGIVRERARLRRIETNARRIAELVRTPGANPDELLAQAVENFTELRKATGPGAYTGTPYVMANEMAVDYEVAELVDGLIEVGGFGCMYGESNCGKSTLAMALSYSVGTSTPWLGRRTRGGPVVYVAAEAGKSIARRVAAFRKDVPQYERAPVAVITVKRQPVSRDKATAAFTHPGRRLGVRVVGCRGWLRGL